MKSPDGVDRVARWREGGRWWACESPLEFEQVRMAGHLRETQTPYDQPWVPHAKRVELHENHREDYVLRPRKIRDEKVGRACGKVKDPAVVPYQTVSQTYVPLMTMSGYSFGRSLLFAKELPRLAAQRGLPVVALTDWFSLAGAMEFGRECRAHGVKPLIGATLEMEAGGCLVLIARDRQGYVSLSQLITRCHLEQPRLYPLARWEWLEEHSRGLICLTGGDRGLIDQMVTAKRYAEATQSLARLKGLYGPHQVWVQMERSYLPWEVRKNAALETLASELGLRCVAGSPVVIAHRSDYPALDVVQCAATLCTVEEIIGRKLPRHPDQPAVPHRPLREWNGERYLRSGAEFAELYSDQPEWVEETRRLAEHVDPWVLPERSQLPLLAENPALELRERVSVNVKSRYGILTPGLKQRIDLELNRIVGLGFADHFLIAHDFCQWATEQGILYSGRGSVVDSVIAYVLGLSRIDAYIHDLHFDRFLPPDGSKRPDIDIDFEATRRDDIRLYLSQKYGADHVAGVCAFGAFCTRGIIREVGKALELPDRVVGFLAKRIHGSVHPEQIEAALERKPELRASEIPRERLYWLFDLAGKLMDVPRNLRAHSSGVVLSRQPINEIVPMQWAGDGGDEEHPLKLIQWDKRSAKHVFDKFDILCLRGQDVLSGLQQRIRRHQPEFRVEQIDLEDPELYRTMRGGELIGIPQSASPAMRQAHMRLQTQDLTDASLVQAGIRPGVGGAVKMNELIARRRGEKPYVFDCPELEEILGHTYGIVVFQEQIDLLLQAFPGYTGGEAEEIREEIHKRRREDYGQVIKDEVIRRTLERGFNPTIAEHVFELVANFKGYGFAQGHALAFAEISVRSIFCQQNFPAAYFASLLDAQPAGYYGPCTLVNEARNRGVRILPVDVNASELYHEVKDIRSDMDPHITLPDGAIRLPLNTIKGLSRHTLEKTVSERNQRRFVSINDFMRRVKPSVDEGEYLVLSGALDSLYPHRRALLWHLPILIKMAREQGEHRLPLPLMPDPPPGEMPDFSIYEKALLERELLGLDVHQHLMAFERARISAKSGVTTAEAKQAKPGERITVVGNPIRLRFPPTPSGKRVCFFDLEDESGLLNVTCFDRVYQQDGHAIICSPYVTLRGVIQDRDGHPAFMAQRVFPYHPLLADEAQRSDLPIKIADFLVG